MMPFVDFILLVAGIVVPLTIFGTVLLFHRRRYRSWAKLVALVGSIAALTWGVLEACILYSNVSRHALPQLVASRRVAAVFCLICLFGLLLGRRQKRLEIDAATT
jgi:hypothetical protein